MRVSMSRMETPDSKDRFVRPVIAVLTVLGAVGIWQGYGDWLIGWFARHVA